MFKRFRPRRIDEDTRLRHRETFLKRKDFIWPVFLVRGKNLSMEISSMSGVFRYSVDRLLDELPLLAENGLKAILLFGVPSEKGIVQAYSPDGIVQKAVPLIKKYHPLLEVITDVCLCSYTSDGHCHTGDNDGTCEVLAEIALSHARAGADVVAPSDMMDGRVHYIKKALTANGLGGVKIMSYAAKYASNFYGPFRVAAACAPKSGDRKSYQMDPANVDEAMDEIAADVDEGADSVIIKPALSYLDVIAKARARFKIPIAAYNVSGEYQMLRRAVDENLVRADIIHEVLTSIKRAGADRIISYFTPEVLGKLRD
ncbi:MAG: porphobilinogen synthase [Elusimicrobia bacterium HGW-Elusimicrobia-1]|jgi:porphobilinogen synthase|nr:MAG: porphobilinogen synthase [Elusimicrobia bacterium HGW-Elusimicrobia-1]